MMYVDRNYIVRRFSRITTDVLQKLNNFTFAIPH